MGGGQSHIASVLRIAITALVIAAAVVALAVQPARGQDGVGAETNDLAAYEAVASAEGVRATVILEPSVLVPELVDLGAPVAQARADSLGNSTGYAAAPFPGDLLLRGPALLFPAFGLPVDLVPPFPAIVESAYPLTPSAGLDVGAYRLRTTSAERGSHASAGIGGLLAADLRVGAVTSEASTEVLEDATVLARSSTAVEGLKLGGLTIARIEATAEVRARSADDVELDGGFAVHLVDTAGLAVTIDSDGITVAGTSIPLSLIDLVPVASLLAVDGFEIELLPERRDEGSFQSGGLLIRTTTELADGIPNVLAAGSTVTVEVVVGRASASASAFELPIREAVTPPATTPPSTTPEAVAAPAPAPSPSPELPSPAPNAADNAGIRNVITTTTSAITLSRWSLAGVFPVMALAGIGIMWAARTFRPRGDRT